MTICAALNVVRLIKKVFWESVSLHKLKQECCTAKMPLNLWYRINLNWLEFTAPPTSWECLPCVGHALHCDFWGACDHTGVPGRDDDSGGDGIGRTSHIWTDRPTGQHTHIPSKNKKTRQKKRRTGREREPGVSRWWCPKRFFAALCRLGGCVLIDLTYWSWPARTLRVSSDGESGKIGRDGALTVYNEMSAGESETGTGKYNPTDRKPKGACGRWRVFIVCACAETSLCLCVCVCVSETNSSERSACVCVCVWDVSCWW